MADPQLLAYLQQQLQVGHTEAELRQVLLANGYQQAAIDDAFNALHGSRPAAHAVNMRVVLIAVAVLAALGAGVLIFSKDDALPAQTTAPLPVESLSYRIDLAMKTGARDGKEAAVQECRLLHGTDADTCMLVIASAEQDYRICASVQDPTLQQECLINFLGTPSEEKACAQLPDDIC